MTLIVPRTKICGVTRPADLEVLAAAGTDCVGLNFVSSSKRRVSLEDGQRLSSTASKLGLKVAAVVMDMPEDELAQLVEAVPVDFLQLHGSERPEVLEGLRKPLPIIKALSWSGRDAEQQLATQWNGVPSLVAFLVDAFAPGVGGGTGKTVRWDLLSPRPDALSRLPLILAGGLKPENVAQAIAIAQPHGVDTASGVETQPGIKDDSMVHAFTKNAQAALRVGCNQG
ncbi:MAG: phosphoribosylanthranilate isomerase [Aureliella sp.]